MSHLYMLEHTLNLRPCFCQALAFAFAGLAFLASATAQTVPAAPLAKLRVVGGLAGINQYVRHEEPFWTRELARLTGGKYSAEVAPFDRSGVPGEEMLRLMSLGVTPFGTTGEGPSFSLAERKEAVEQLIRNGIPAAQIMVSTSCAALPETLELTLHALRAGVHGCLMLPPDPTLNHDRPRP